MAHDERDPSHASTPEERALKQARARRMTDPLGAMGFRDTRQRYEREARARKAVFGGTAASFLVGTALIVAASQRGSDGAPAAAATTVPVQVVTGQPGTQAETELAPASVGNAPVNSTESNRSEITVQTQRQSDGAGTGLSSGETRDALSRTGQLPTAQSTSTSTSRYSDDEGEGEHDGEYVDDEHEGGDDAYENSIVIQGQQDAAPVTGSRSNGTSEIVIAQPTPHTRTNSTR